MIGIHGQRRILQLCSLGTQLQPGYSSKLLDFQGINCHSTSIGRFQNCHDQCLENIAVVRKPIRKLNKRTFNKDEGLSSYKASKLRGSRL